jgi:OPA family sugar phosphate sensor protein UhpC-like MFS transporter
MTTDARPLPAVDADRLRHWQLQIFSLLWTSYASYYLCRVNFAVAQPELLREFGWTSAQVGLIPSVYAAFYAVGQFINGQLGERFGARRMMTLAMLVAGGCNLLFSFTSSYPAMLALWAVNGVAQSAGWSLVVKTISNWTTVRRRGVVIGLISTCYQVGNVIAWLLAGVLCESLGWRAAFWVPALVILPMSALMGLFLRNQPQDAGLAPVREDLAQGATPSGPGAPVKREGFLDVLRDMLKNRVLWVLAIAFFSMNGVRYAFMNWAVQYMADFHGRTIKGSAFTAVALPLIGAVGAVFAGWASDSLFGKRRAPMCAVMLSLLALTCVGFTLVPRGEWVLATGLLGLAGFLIYGPDMLASGAATVDVHPRAAAAATGFTMATGAAGAIFSGAGVGWLKDHAAALTGGALDGWTLIFYVLGAMSVVSTLLMVSIWNARPR